MDLDLSQYRKIITLIVTGAVVYGLQLVGLGPTDLPGFGFSLGGVTEPLVDFLLTIGIPAVFALAQPNERGESIWAYWRWIVGGLAVVAVLIIVVLVL